MAADRVRRAPRGRRRPPAPNRLVSHDEAFRTLRTNLLVATSDMTNPSVLVTSALPGEGKTSTCAALAASIAASGPMVVAVDLDLRRPDLHLRFGVDNGRGVGDVLSGRESVADCLVRVGPPGKAASGSASGSDAGAPDPPDGGYPGRGSLFVLPAGRPVDHPAELLGGPRTTQLLDALRQSADFVLIDTPPVLSVADTLGIGRLASGALLVVETGRAPLPAVQRAKAELTRNQIRLLGIVLNRFEDQGGLAPYRYDYSSDVVPNRAPVGDLTRFFGRSRNGDAS